MGWKRSKKLASSGKAIHINLAGDKIILFSAAKLSTIGITGGESKAIEFDADTVIDPAAWNEHRFDESIRVVSEIFYDPTMKGLDWDALTARYKILRSPRAPTVNLNGSWPGCLANSTPATLEFR